MSAFYRTGSVAATNGSATVTGTTTAWAANAKPGDILFFDGDAGRGYEITDVASNTEVTISPAYAGTTGSGKAYGIARVSTAWNSVSELAVSLADVLDGQSMILSGSGAPSDTVGTDGDIYFRETPATYYRKASGTWSSGTAITGPAGPAGPSYAATSTTSLAIGTGSKTFTVETSRPYTVGLRLRASKSDDPAVYMEGVVASYSSTTLNLTVDRVAGSGTVASWAINVTGEPGPANALAIGTVTTGAAGSSASATLSGTPPNQTLNLTIPRGNTGATGSQGLQGPQGNAATVTVGTVTTGAAGTSAAVTNSGTSAAATFNFTIPRGAKGAMWRGDYNGATAYVADDLVRDQGAIWINVAASTGTAPPTLPTETNANWELFVEKGDPGGVTEINGETGSVSIDGGTLDAAYTPSNYTAGDATLAAHLAGLDDAIANVGGIALGAVATTTSGTAIDFTGIPAGTKRVSVNFSGVSTTSTSLLLVQIGDSGGIESTGYAAVGGNITSSTSTASQTAGFPAGNNNAAAALISGTLTLVLTDPDANTWACSGVFARTDVGYLLPVAGTKSLSNVLDRVRVTTVSGTPTFDAGKINITFE